MQVKFSNCVCVVKACTSRPVCQGRTIFSSVTGLSPAPFQGSDAGSLAFPCLPPVPGCKPPRLARRRGKSAFDGPVGTERGGWLGLRKRWNPREEQHALTDRAWHWRGPQLRPGIFPPPMTVGLLTGRQSWIPYPMCLPCLYVRWHFLFKKYPDVIKAVLNQIISNIATSL